ncbi:MAG: Ig-like domain-containing protein [bacterium]|nr:Ig-like domain-containing protein [bacterium]
MAGQKNRNRKKNRRNVRALAALLGLALVMGDAPHILLAAEPEIESLSENTVEEQETPQEPQPEGEQDAPPENEDGTSSGDGDTTPDEEGDVPSNEDEETPDTVSENDTETVSENTPDTVSENDLESVSENTPDTEWEAIRKKAQEAFAALAADKPLMALLYHADSYTAREKADEKSDAAAVLEIGQTLYIQSVEITEEDVWYRVQYLLDGAEGTGYVQSYYLAYSDEDWLAWEEEYLLPLLASEAKSYRNTAFGMASIQSMPYAAAASASDVSAFPASYQAALNSLKSAHPNWTFVPMKTGLDFNTSVSKEMGVKSLIQKTNDNTANGWVGASCPSESGWYYATQLAVAYHMDPRNFLTETYIFQFEQLTFNASYHTEDAVQTFLNGTFMKGKLADDADGRTYAQAFFGIGKNRKLSPIHLASRVYQEQGQGTSGLISGTYPGYEGYYNFFNVGVNGSSTAEKIVKGLTYAKEKGWNTRYKSLEGGAATIGNNYILKGQDTIYLEKFNVNKNSSYGVYEHQYMQNIQAPRSESSSTKKMYAGAGSLNNAFVFKIPVFDNMPEENPLESISLDKKTVTLRRPDTVVEDTTNLSEEEKKENTSTATLQVSFDPEDTSSDKTIVWTSANPKIATVKVDPEHPEDTSRAVVTAVGTGTVKITAKASKAGGKTAVCQVTVIAPIYQVTLTNRNTGEDAEGGQTTLFAGQSVNLSAEYLPKDTTSDTSVTWSSSAPEVASVVNGKVTAQGVVSGKNAAVIKARIAGYEASYTVKVESCTVTFRKRDQKTALGEAVTVRYGDVLPEEVFAEKQKLLGADPSGSRFIGWYTGENGTGSRFDETSRVYGKNLTLYPYYVEYGTGFYVLPVGDQTYTGSAVKPKIEVYDGTVRPDGTLLAAADTECLALKEGVDYTVSYQNNKNVDLEGKPVPTIVVKGKGNYTGTQKLSFHIVPKALTDVDITAEDITAAYSGKVIKSAPTVLRDGKKLAKNRDYTVAYPLSGIGAYRTAGVYPVVITGKGGYTGTITIYETITKMTLMSKVSVAKIANRTYSKEEMAQKGGIRPDSLKVTWKKQLLTESTDGGRTGDYTVSYQNDTAVGTATATITAVEGSGFTGSKSVTYKIVGTPISRAKVSGLENKEYTGTEQDARQSGYVLTLGDRTLVESTDGGRTGDYTVSYAGAAKEGAVKAGTATILFKGINEFSGQLKKSYRILPYELHAENVGNGRDIVLTYHTQDEPEREIGLAGLNGMTAPYVKGGSKPTIGITFRGQTLVQGKDYTVSYKNNNALTTAETEEKKLPAYTIKGKGSFKGTLAGTFTITDGRMDKEGKLTMTAKDVVWREKKNAWKPKVTIKDVSGAALAAGRDYDKNLRYTYAEDAKALVSEDGVLVERDRKAGEEVAAEDIPQAGTILRVTAAGIGAYAGESGTAAEISAVCRIVAADLAKVRVKVAAKAYQDGRPVTLTAEDLTVTVGAAAEPLECGVDYQIDAESYVNHTKKGKAKVTLRGLGNYGGEKTITYTIGAKILIFS